MTRPRSWIPHWSRVGLEPNDDEGEWSVWVSAMITDSDWGLVPSSTLGGSRRIGGVKVVALKAASSEEMNDSTSTLSSFKIYRFVFWF